MSDFEKQLFQKAYGGVEETPAETPVEQPTEQAAAATTATETIPETIEETIVETPADTTPSVPTESSPEISILKDLGFETVDQLKEALNRQPEALQPELNETSKALYEAILNGKEEEVAEILYTKKQLKALETETDKEKVLKAYIGLINPEFDQDDINDEYAEMYSLSEEAEYDESRRKREEKKLNQKIKADFEKAKEYFSSKSQEIKLPTFEKQQEGGDDNYEQQLAEYRQKFKEGLSSLKTVTPIELTHKVEIEGKEAVIPIKYELDETRLNAIKNELLQDGGYDNLLTRRHYGEGDYKHENIARDFYVLENLDKIMDAVATQAVNKARIEWLKTQKGISNNTATEGALPEDIQKTTQNESLKKLFFG